MWQKARHKRTGLEFYVRMPIITYKCLIRTNVFGIKKPLGGRCYITNMITNIGGHLDRREGRKLARVREQDIKLLDYKTKTVTLFNLPHRSA